MHPLFNELHRQLQAMSDIRKQFKKTLFKSSTSQCYTDRHTQLETKNYAEATSNQNTSTEQISDIFRNLSLIP